MLARSLHKLYDYQNRYSEAALVLAEVSGAECVTYVIAHGLWPLIFVGAGDHEDTKDDDDRTDDDDVIKSAEGSVEDRLSELVDHRRSLDVCRHIFFVFVFERSAASRYSNRRSLSAAGCWSG